MRIGVRYSAERRPLTVSLSFAAFEHLRGANARPARATDESADAQKRCRRAIHYITVNHILNAA